MHLAGKNRRRLLLAEIRQHNPLLFDFVLKRNLRVNGKQLSPAVFETRAFFARQARVATGRDFFT